MQPSEEQRELQRTVRRLLERSADSAALRKAVESDVGYDTEVWRRLAAEVGVAALGVPERYDGTGFTALESMLVLEELGGMLTPSPMLGSAVLATQALLLSGDDQACHDLLPALARGERTAALAWLGPNAWGPDSTAVTACPTSAGASVLTGRAHHVLDGDTADDLVVAARTGDGIGLFAVGADQEGLERRPANGMDLTRRLSTVTLDHCQGRLLGEDGTGTQVLTRVRDLACAGLAMEQVGAAARCLQQTVAYTKEREQFGRPIGSFQAIKHRLADLYVLVQTARSAAYAATAAAAEPDAGDLAHGAAVAKVYCSEALFAVASEAVQLHGGIAITWEHDAQLYLKRAHGSMQLFGQPRAHVSRLADVILG
ncbi:MAG TPA: acyl-CoA dehydrogenase family protein [Nocardioidaceae bacterium]|nr:acyl-CoA dehydrogenase family protein [Nocardioidaceae bacterium]